MGVVARRKLSSRLFPLLLTGALALLIVLSLLVAVRDGSWRALVVAALCVFLAPLAAAESTEQLHFHESGITRTRPPFPRREVVGSELQRVKLFTPSQWFFYAASRRRPVVKLELFKLKNADEVSAAAKRLCATHRIPIEYSDIFDELQGSQDSKDA